MMTPPLPEVSVAGAGEHTARVNEPAALSELVFSLSWEDPELDRQAFGELRGKTLCAVSSGGCNVLTFLLDDPERIVAFDYNQSQTHVLELKLAAIRALDYAGLLELLGVRPSQRRGALYAALRPLLSAAASAYWDAAPWLVSKGLLGGGRYERFVGAFRKFLHVVQGERRIQGLFAERDEAERRRYFDAQWNTWAWRMLFKAFFNRTLLARRGLAADYFTFDDGSRSFAESFARRAEHAMTALSVRDNPFLAQYLLGRYLDEDHLPRWLQPEQLPVLKERVDRVVLRTADARRLFEAERNVYDGICLSNVCELMSEADTTVTLRLAAQALRGGGMLTLRNLMVPRRASAELNDLLTLQRARSEELLRLDRSFVYSAFLVYSRTIDSVWA
jgi:S-adenosylmethionine-diacylglycerol 3-amino-3-carboxypropyl transferase